MTGTYLFLLFITTTNLMQGTSAQLHGIYSADAMGVTACNTAGKEKVAAMTTPGVVNANQRIVFACVQF